MPWPGSLWDRVAIRHLISLRPVEEQRLGFGRGGPTAFLATITRTDVRMTLGDRGEVAQDTARPKDKVSTNRRLIRMGVMHKAPLKVSCRARADGVPECGVGPIGALRFVLSEAAGVLGGWRRAARWSGRPPGGVEEEDR